MLKIRLKRLGRKKKVFYKVVVMENLSRRDGQAIDELGYYDPLKKVINLNKAKLIQYLQVGAYPTNTVRHLILNYIQKLNQTK